MSPAPRLRVLVASDQALVAEVVSLALEERGFETSVFRWPAASVSEVSLRPALEIGHGVAPLAGALFVSELDRPHRVEGALRLIRRLPLPWVILSQEPRGPLWGELLESGASVVSPASASLDDVATTLGALAQGTGGTLAAERRELTDAWHALQAEQTDLADRVASMTPREAEVLKLLYAGTPVRMIARRLEVSEATVRTQVKRVLRKLGVQSQLAAVAALDTVRQGEAPGRPRLPSIGYSSG